MLTTVLIITRSPIKGREELISSLPRRYLKKDTKKKFLRLREVLQRILNWFKEKLPEKQTAAVSSTEVLPGQVDNDDREVNNRYVKETGFLSFFYIF